MRIAGFEPAVGAVLVGTAKNKNHTRRIIDRVRHGAELVRFPEKHIAIVSPWSGTTDDQIQLNLQINKP